VAFDRGVVTSQGHIAKSLGLVQVVQDRQQVVLVVVPLQAKHLRQRVHFGDGQLGQQMLQKIGYGLYFGVNKPATS